MNDRLGLITGLPTAMILQSDHDNGLLVYALAYSCGGCYDELVLSRRNGRPGRVCINGSAFPH